jgi:hypothetical protein
MNDDPSTGKPLDVPTIALPNGVPHWPPPPASTSSIGGEEIDPALLADVKQQGNDRNERRTRKNNTQLAYVRHFNEYKTWWEGDQTRRRLEAEKAKNPFIPTPTLPITAVKVALFLDYVTTRPIVCSMNS